jgi:hypothetical protein
MIKASRLTAQSQPTLPLPPKNKKKETNPSNNDALAYEHEVK